MKCAYHNKWCDKWDRGGARSFPGMFDGNKSIILATYVLRYAHFVFSVYDVFK